MYNKYILKTSKFKFKKVMNFFSGGPFLASHILVDCVTTPSGPKKHLSPLTAIQ